MRGNDPIVAAAGASSLSSDTCAGSVQALPDIIEPGLSILFCGINPGLSAASSGHHFAGRGNRFWKVLHRAGFTSEEFRPENDSHLLTCGCGLTAAVPRATARADQLPRAEIRAAAAQFELKVRHFAPRFIAFLGKLALAEMSGQRNIEWGLQATDFGGARIWVLPNPSGLNRSFSLDALVSAYRELRIAAQASAID
ncbi:G/U mismatch-specific DNA glycosylase [Paraburkholderia phenoliruptrix]|uniref:TDG/mug DNA glucosyllase family protein n=2 Tax=Paraburkholderia phenoliruptrix TaxID=252970 RepID=K0E0D2_9BURK|nr:G/U mismatch-specific DNA glycosylase [Paraburkholderia phenoliruptrix]AFT89863.1 TDG/mug DNA glucosyllase family protein [Paraburkholderia phenoliruptrix BR3459a]MDR6417796.1 TDG/mug DNA glycosylase family protein [Paraburkholderia phenoliruptrix]CAB4046468.1 G/U mismatch-specific DNA glycosylase [Paraburkholderia phenoliruptrix]